MVTLLLDSTQLEVVLSRVEHALAFRKGNVAIERTAIVKVQLTDDVWTWLRGVPSPGTHIRGAVAMGTWKSAGASDFVLIRRHQPGVVIDLQGNDEFERVILTTRHGLALARALRLDADDEAADVAAFEDPAPPETTRREKKPRKRAASQPVPST